ncbi:MAG: SDR family oxidoreductase [Acidobacteriota bacterium]
MTTDHSVNGEQPILVIGGTRGTGLIIARLLRRHGHRVRVLARDPARAQTLFDQAVEVIAGDITKPGTLRPAIEGARHIVFTAGCRSGYPVGESKVKATEYHGALNTLDAASALGLPGRFLYMTSSGLLTPSLSTFCLNLWKGNTLVWRRRVEDDIRASGLEYTIVRTGVLLNREGGQRTIEITQQPLPLSIRYRIARIDVARVFVSAMQHPKAARATFEAVWGRRGDPESWSRLLDRVQPDEGPH